MGLLNLRNLKKLQVVKLQSHISGGVSELYGGLLGQGTRPLMSTERLVSQVLKKLKAGFNCCFGGELLLLW